MTPELGFDDSQTALYPGTPICVSARKARFQPPRHGRVAFAPPPGLSGGPPPLTLKDQEIDGGLDLLNRAVAVVAQA